ncbi:transposase [Candidatus Dojkabacteria bacterium]|jgi:transposase|nr:transposase [Candidatus Dojkabacteria bacterium]
MKTVQNIIKPEEIRLTFPLNLDIVQSNGKIKTVPQQKIDDMIESFKDSANSAIEIITKKIYPRLIILDNPKKGYCPLCYPPNTKKKKKSELIYRLKDFEIGHYNFNGKEYSCIKFVKGKKSLPFCDCIKKNNTAFYRLRKFLLPSETHDTPFDMTIAGRKLNGKYKIARSKSVFNLSKSNYLGGYPGNGYRAHIFDSCLQKACEAIKSQNEINKKIQEKIEKIDYKIIYQKKFIMNQLDLKIKKEREWNSSLKIYSIKRIKKFITDNELKIKRLTKKISKEVVYKKSVVRLYESDYKLLQDPVSQKYSIEIKDIYTDKMMLPINFLGQDNTKYMERLKPYLNMSKKCETEISRIEPYKNMKIKNRWKWKQSPVYKLHYIFKQEKKKIEFTKEMMPLGIDLGIANLQTMSLWDNAKNKPVKIKFYNGRPIRRKRQQMTKIRKIISKRNTAKIRSYLLNKGYAFNKNPQNYIEVIKKMGNTPEQKYMNNQMHNHTTEIIKKCCLWKAEYKKDIVIVIEDLLDIRENINMESGNLKVLGKCNRYSKNTKNLKTKRFWKRKNNFITNINKWTYAQWLNNLKYKAELNGIPLVILPKRFIRMSSTKCNKCNHIDENNRKGRRFLCLNCKYKSDADYNASVNIAKSYYEWLIWKEEKKEEKKKKNDNKKSL